MTTKLDKLKEVRKALNKLDISIDDASKIIEECQNVDFEYEDELDRLEFLSESYKESLDSNLRDQTFVLKLKKSLLVLAMTLGVGLGTLTFAQNKDELKCKMFVIIEMLAAINYQASINCLCDLSLDEVDYRYKVKKIQYDRKKLEEEHLK